MLSIYKANIGRGILDNLSRTIALLHRMLWAEVKYCLIYLYQMLVLYSIHQYEREVEKETYAQTEG